MLIDLAARLLAFYPLAIFMVFTFFAAALAVCGVVQLSRQSLLSLGQRTMVAGSLSIAVVVALYVALRLVP